MQNQIYRINLKELKNFEGIQSVDNNSVNIGFIEDEKGNKYYKRVNSIELIKEQYDFYCDDTYLYIKSLKNPYEQLGELKLATRTNLILLKSNMQIQNIKVEDTGAQGIVGIGEKIENIVIENCNIQDIGGSILKEDVRYGNGIEFYNMHTKNVEVKNNIIKNTYDVAFTIQGTVGSGENIKVHDNVLINNTQDSEIWENTDAKGIVDYKNYNNISINQGRGWGYEAREDKYAAASILFWEYTIENTKIQYENNILYNPKRIYFVEQTKGSIDLFKKDKILSDKNTYYLQEDATLFREEGNINNTSILYKNYGKDLNSTFQKIIKDEKYYEIMELINTTESIIEIKNQFKRS